MRRKLTMATASAAALALALTGCAGGDEGAGTEGGQVTLQMVESLTNPARTDLLKSMIADFEKANPDVKVQLVSPPTEQADQKLQQMLQSGSGIDVLEVRDLTVGPFSNNKWLYDMSTEIKGWDGLSKLTDQAQNVALDADGKSYFVPYGFYGLSLFYRTDMVKDAGFDGAPRAGTTWSSRPPRSRTRQRTSTATPSVAGRTRRAS
ncbi:ABC transporter substrate-binding protein [Tessaracoccus coleopterorum]|uniref:ABC transporter substrate-binding protein n=1 Tax=Tessaracoccus coleopterorum TaxID=2714950 RepID=UPI001E4B586B|nr:extracellular solute-binding protein [Tessaracoccus coleopterorum]